MKLESDLTEHSVIAAFSDNLLAKRYGLCFRTVEHVRRKLEAIGVIPSVALRRCADGFERNTAHIGPRSPRSAID